MLAVRALLSRPLTPEQTQFEFQPIVPLGGKLSGQYEVGFKVKSMQHPGTTVAYADLAPVVLAGRAPDFFEACALGQLDRVAALLAQDAQLVNAYSGDGFTGLGTAARVADDGGPVEMKPKVCELMSKCV